MFLNQGEILEIKFGEIERNSKWANALERVGPNINKTQKVKDWHFLFLKFNPIMDRNKFFLYVLCLGPLLYKYV